MKTPKIVSALSQVDDDIVSEAACEKKMKRNIWLKWGSIAACFTVMLAVMLSVMPTLLENGNIDIPLNSETSSESEYKYEKGYFYQIDNGEYSTYVGGKVIAKDKIGNKIADVSLTAGWKDNNGEWKSETEALRGEIYAIKGVSPDIAVALKFIDKGEAVTTTHYYVIMNPSADLTPVKDYIIAPIAPNNPGDEMAGEINE